MQNALGGVTVVIEFAPPHLNMVKNNHRWLAGNQRQLLDGRCSVGLLFRNPLFCCGVPR